MIQKKSKQIPRNMERIREHTQIINRENVNVKLGKTSFWQTSFFNGYPLNEAIHNYHKIDKKSSKRN